jgi:hypothetical protein
VNILYIIVVIIIIIIIIIIMSTQSNIIPASYFQDSGFEFLPKGLWGLNIFRVFP